MLLLDILLLLMTVICTLYCWFLNKKIQDLQNSRVEFARMVKELNVSIAKASVSVTELNDMSKSLNNNLKPNINIAEKIIEQLNGLNNVATEKIKLLSLEISKAIKQQQDLRFANPEVHNNLGNKSFFNDRRKLDVSNFKTGYAQNLGGDFFSEEDLALTLEDELSSNSNEDIKAKTNAGVYNDNNASLSNGSVFSNKVQSGRDLLYTTNKANGVPSGLDPENNKIDLEDIKAQKNNSHNNTYEDDEDSYEKLGKFFDKVKQKASNAINLNQTNYYNSLKKISGKK